MYRTLLVVLAIAHAHAKFVTFADYLSSQKKAAEAPVKPVVPPPSPPPSKTTAEQLKQALQKTVNTTRTTPQPRAVVPPPASRARAQSQNEQSIPHSKMHCTADRWKQALANVGAQNKTLLFVMPTIGRPENKEYLKSSIDSILEPILAWRQTGAAAYFAIVKILVVSFEPLQHNKAFAKLYASWHQSIDSDPLRQYVELLELGEDVRFRSRYQDPPDLPPEIVRTNARHRQQTLDFATLLLLLEQRHAHVSIIVEDDVVMCKNALERLFDDLCFLDAVHGDRWSTIRLGMGFMSIGLRHESLHSLRRFWQLYYLVRPCDLLYDDWAYGTLPGALRFGNIQALSSRPIAPASFWNEYNDMQPRELADNMPIQEQLVLFGHRGTISSIGNKYSDAPYACGGKLRDMWVQPSKAFYDKSCDGFNVWPCKR